MALRPRSAIAAPSAWPVLCGCALALVLGATPGAAQPAPAPMSALPSGGLEARFNEAVLDFGRDPRFKDVPEQQLRKRIEFVAGNVIFATVHEIGHMLISEMGLPVLGREADAA